MIVKIGRDYGHYFEMYDEVERVDYHWLDNGEAIVDIWFNRDASDDPAIVLPNGQRFRLDHKTVAFICNDEGKTVDKVMAHQVAGESTLTKG